MRQSSPGNRLHPLQIELAKAWLSAWEIILCWIGYLITDTVFASRALIAAELCSF
jgi:hypothetical protein